MICATFKCRSFYLVTRHFYKEKVMKKITEKDIAPAVLLSIIFGAVYFMIFQLFSKLFMSSLLGHATAVVILIVAIGLEILSIRARRKQVNFAMKPREVIVTDEDIRAVLRDTCDSAEEAEFRFENKGYGGLVLYLSKERA